MGFTHRIRSTPLSGELYLFVNLSRNLGKVPVWDSKDQNSATRSYRLVSSPPMAAIWFTGASYIATLSDIVGYRSGLALSTMKMRRLLASDGKEAHAWPGSLTDGMRVRAEEFEQTVRSLLHKLGRLRSPSMFTPFEWLHAMRRRPKQRSMVDDLLTWLSSASSSGGPGPIDIIPLFEKAVSKYGLEGFKIAEELIAVFKEHTQGSILSSFREIEWKDVIQLDELFKSENVPTHGEFFDQRFIDYLHRNFEDISHIHWRQFERLTAEYFSREGFRVQLGPGRADNGIDVRVWREDSASPTILIQCKRQKSDVGQVVVKALWADILNEDAESGLIVTTSRLEPGADRIRVARSYPIDAATQDTLRQWILSMRIPFAGGRITT